jgi:hypothetical protein
MYVYAFLGMHLIIMGAVQLVQLAPIQAQTNYDVSVPVTKYSTQIFSHVQHVLPIQLQIAIKQLAGAFQATPLLMETVCKYQPARQIKC